MSEGTISGDYVQGNFSIHPAVFSSALNAILNGTTIIILHRL